MQLVRRHGPPEQKALALVAADLGQQVPLRIGLKLPGHHGQAKRLTRGDDGPDQGCVLAVVRQGAHQAAIEFQCGQRQPPQHR